MASKNRPMLGSSIEQELKSPDSPFKQFIAKAIAEIEKSIKQTEELVKNTLKNARLEELMIIEEGKEENVLKETIQFKPIDPIMAQTFGSEGKQYQELIVNMNKLRGLQSQLNDLMKTSPEVFRHLRTANENRAARNTKALSEILDTSFKNISSDRKEIIVNEFNQFEQSATTALMAEARYRRSLNQSQASQGPVNSNSVSANINQERDATAIATKNVVQQELQMQIRLKSLLQETNPEMSDAQAMLAAGRIIKARFTSDEVIDRVSEVLSTFSENEINDTVREMDEKGLENSMVAKATAVQGLLREVAKVESEIQFQTLQISPKPPSSTKVEDEEKLQQKTRQNQTIKR